MEPAIAKRSKADKIGVTTVFSQNEGVSNDEPQLARQAASVLVGTSIAPWEFLPCGVKTGTQRASAVRGGARAPGQTENHEAEPSPARRCHLRVLGAPNRLHPHRPLRLHRSLEPPRARRGHNQASGVGAHSSTLLHLLHPPPPPPHSSSSSTLLLLRHLRLLHHNQRARAPHPSPQIWNEVYSSGRHFLGVGKRFHTFPMDYRLVDFSWMTMATSYGDTFYDAPSLVGRTPQAPAPPPAPAPHAPATRPGSSPIPSPSPSHTPHVKRRTPHG